MQGLVLVGQLLEAWHRLVSRVYHSYIVGNDQVIPYMLFPHIVVHIALSYVTVLHSLCLMCSCNLFALLGWLRSHLNFVQYKLWISMYAS